MQDFQCLEDRVLIEPIVKKEEKTDGGLYIPETVRKDVSEGLVVGVGPGVYARDTGVFIPTVLKEGETVLFGSGQGMPITIGKKDLKILREGDVILLITKNLDNS